MNSGKQKKSMQKKKCALLECGNRASYVCTQCEQGLCNYCLERWHGPCPFCRNPIQKKKRNRCQIVPVADDDYSEELDSSPRPRHHAWRRCSDMLFFNKRTRRCISSIIVQLSLCCLCVMLLKLLLFGSSVTYTESVLLGVLVFFTCLHCQFQLECEHRFCLQTES